MFLSNGEKKGGKGKIGLCVVRDWGKGGVVERDETSYKCWWIKGKGKKRERGQNLKNATGNIRKRDWTCQQKCHSSTHWAAEAY